MIRRAFEAEVRRRFAKLRKAVVDFLVEKDALGLAPRKPFVVMVQPREYEFLTDASKLKAFNEWLQQQIEADILSTVPGASGDPWTHKYIESAWKKGVVGAYAATKARQIEMDEMEPSQARFLRDAFSQPERLSKVRLLATRSFEGMKGVTASMASKMNFILAQGMVEGRSAREIAKQMTDDIKGLERQRALVIARTEVIYAHAEGQLDSFEELGVEELGVEAEWSTAGDDRVCPQCSGMEGQTFNMKEARGLIPLHPNCRCTWIPALEKMKA